LQARSIAEVTKAVALGDLSKQIEVDVLVEIFDLKNTVNGMVIWLRALAAKVMRVTLEVGSQGKLGEQTHVPDVKGVWFELVRNVSVFIATSTESFRSLMVYFVSFPGQSNVLEFDGPSAVNRQCHGRSRHGRLGA
jgi:osomolarity two-component system sensor histidine kinase NIK1